MSDYFNIKYALILLFLSSPLPILYIYDTSGNEVYIGEGTVLLSNSHTSSRWPPPKTLIKLNDKRYIRAICNDCETGQVVKVVQKKGIISKEIRYSVRLP